MIGNAAHVPRILEQLGLSAQEIVAATPQGIANHTWLCDAWVVRISKDPEYLSDLLTESVAAPAAFAAGVPSAEPIYFSLEPKGDTPPFSVYRRVQGEPLSRIDLLPHPERFFIAYGSALRVVHSIECVHDPSGLLDEAWELEPASVLQTGTQLGVEDLISQLLSSAGSHPNKFVHQDLHADNVLVDAAGNPVFLDWGDAGFGDPATDFRFIPASYIRSALEGYGDFDTGLVSRIKLHVFDQYVCCQKLKRSYGIYGDSDWRDVLSLLQLP